jgi:hypothetical protein
MFGFFWGVMRDSNFSKKLEKVLFTSVSGDRGVEGSEWVLDWFEVA